MTKRAEFSLEEKSDLAELIKRFDSIQGKLNIALKALEKLHTSHSKSALPCLACVALADIYELSHLHKRRMESSSADLDIRDVYGRSKKNS